jgi:hypothetical protein
MRFYCSESENSRLIVDRFKETCDASGLIFLSGPRGSDFYPLVREYVLGSNWSEDSLIVCSYTSLSEGILGDIAALLKRKMPKVILVRLPRNLDEIEEKELIQFLENPAFSSAKWILAIEDLDPYEQENPYSDLLVEKAKEAMFVLPALTKRHADLAKFAVSALHEAENKTRGSKDFGFSDDAIELMLKYPWPGNYEELSSVMRVIGSSYDPSSPISEELLEQTISMGRTSEM